MWGRYDDRMAWARGTQRLETVPDGCLQMPVATEWMRIHGLKHPADQWDFNADFEARKLAVALDTAISEGDPDRLKRLQTAIAINGGGERSLSSLAKSRIPEATMAALGPLAALDRQSWVAERARLKEELAKHKADADLLARQGAEARATLIGHLKAGKLTGYRWRHDTGSSSEPLPAHFWQSDAASLAMEGKRIFRPMGGIPGPMGHEESAVVRLDDLRTMYSGAVQQGAAHYGAPAFQGKVAAWVARREAQEAAQRCARKHAMPWKTRADVARALSKVLEEMGYRRKSVERSFRGIPLIVELDHPEKIPPGIGKK